VLRYQYDTDADGNAISPTLYPKKEDEINFAGRWFRLKAVTPVTSEDNLVICYECRAVPASAESQLEFPLEFPIVFGG